jgi:hypothetical protein
VSIMQMKGEQRRIVPNELGRKHTMPGGWVMVFSASAMSDQKADCQVTGLCCNNVSASNMAKHQSGSRRREISYSCLARLQLR